MQDTLGRAAQSLLSGGGLNPFSIFPALHPLSHYLHLFLLFNKTILPFPTQLYANSHPITNPATIRPFSMRML